MKVIHTAAASQAIGPYSQAIVADGWVFSSGCVGLTAENELSGEDVVTQTRQTFYNLQAILEAAGCGLQDVVKVTVYLADIEEFASMNEVYRSFMKGHEPARSCVEVQRLPRDLRVEIDVVARLPLCLPVVEPTE